MKPFSACDHMKSTLMIAAIVMGAAMPAHAQTPERITLAVNVRTEGRPTRDETAARMEAEVLIGFQAIPGVVMVPPERAGRIVLLVVGSGPSSDNSVSVVVTERYDRTTLLHLGITDEAVAERMMAQRIVIGHELFTGRKLQDLATRIVTWVDDDIFERARMPK